jgi:hypothetical protein
MSLISLSLALPKKRERESTSFFSAQRRLMLPVELDVDDAHSSSGPWSWSGHGAGYRKIAMFSVGYGILIKHSVWFQLTNHIWQPSSDGQITLSFFRESFEYRRYYLVWSTVVGLEIKFAGRVATVPHSLCWWTEGLLFWMHCTRGIFKNTRLCSQFSSGGRAGGVHKREQHF